MRTYDKVHLWIGTTHKSEEDYLSYFELDYSTEGDFEDPNYKVCPFCRDIGAVWYDHDFIGIIPLYEKEMDLDDMLVELAVDAGEWENVKEKCYSMGIKKGNAIFWYADSSLTIPQPYKEQYNGLKYIGLFNGD